MSVLAWEPYWLSYKMIRSTYSLRYLDVLLFSIHKFGEVVIFSIQFKNFIILPESSEAKCPYKKVKTDVSSNQFSHLCLYCKFSCTSGTQYFFLCIESPHSFLIVIFCEENNLLHPTVFPMGSTAPCMKDQNCAHSRNSRLYTR